MDLRAILWAEPQGRKESSSTLRSLAVSARQAGISAPAELAVAGGRPVAGLPASRIVKQFRRTQPISQLRDRRSTGGAWSSSRIKYIFPSSEKRRDQFTLRSCFDI
jgi:hypothetical protein